MDLPTESYNSYSHFLFVRLASLDYLCNNAENQPAQTNPILPGVFCNTLEAEFSIVCSKT